MLRFSMCLACGVLAGCSSVSIQLLTPDLQQPRGQAGLIYYLPAPYLLVAEVPPTAISDSPGLASDEAPTGGPPKDGKTKTPKDSNPGPADSATAAAPPSDTSFGATTPQYVIKLVYLPDLQRPMALTETAGIGTSAIKPVLQDGWMLTSLDASSDSKVSETLSALASLVGSVTGKSAPAATTGPAAPSTPAAESKFKVPPDLSGFFRAGHFILRPGLYKFRYNDSTGVLEGMKALAFFTGCGVIKAAEMNKYEAAAAHGKCKH